MENSTTDFALTLRTFMARTLRTTTDLARLTGISINTLGNWTDGTVRRPRFVGDVLKIARALGLDVAETTTLLKAARHLSLPDLQAQARQSGAAELIELLAAWDDSAAASEPASVESAPQSARLVAPRYQLRLPVADLVGRTRETEQLVAALRAALAQGTGAAVSGVQGMGGIGKTELAYAVAHRLRDAVPDAQIVINLRGSSTTPLTPAQALQAAIRALSPSARLPDDLEALEQHYRTVLHNQRVLILADDARDAAQVRPLLPPLGCVLLIASRQRFALPGMSTIDMELLDADAAVALLASICPRLAVAEAQAIARACGYLPLALRVSGSILHTTPALLVADYLARLADARQRLRQLCDPDDPQLDVAASLSLSYAQLDAAAQQIFRQVGVFMADFGTATAVMVEGGSGMDVEAILCQLLRRNLLMYDAVRGRWRMHDLLRDLARCYLEAAGEQEAVLERYAHVAMHNAVAAQVQYSGPEKFLTRNERRPSRVQSPI